MTETSKVLVSEHLRPVPDCRVQLCDPRTDGRSSAFPEQLPCCGFSSTMRAPSPAKVSLDTCLNEPWLKYTIFNLPSDPKLKHKIPQIRENKIPRKSDLEIEPPMYHPPHPNFFFAKINFYQKKKKNLKKQYCLKWVTWLSVFSNWFITFYMFDVYNIIF